MFVYGGGSLTLTNVRVAGSVVVLPQLGAPLTKLHMIGSAVHAGVTVNVIDSAGNLYWGGPVDVDVLVDGSWIHHPQGDGSYHTEAMSGFGYPRGARFVDSVFVQAGPFNATATGAINWYGFDSVFDHVWFGYVNGTAAYFTVYLRGQNNAVTNCVIEQGLGGHVYPNDDQPLASFSGCVDDDTGAPLTF